ncbi:hypothetical protein, partial [Arcobacter sp.]|uniref:hypothetical protein n=1 Tax=Arcobacter sp. TaxID=1872629 RepID=UPI003D1295FC
SFIVFLYFFSFFIHPFSPFLSFSFFPFPLVCLIFIALYFPSYFYLCFLAPVHFLSSLPQFLGTASLYKIQLSFTNFTTERLSLRVGEVDDFVSLSDQLQLHENEILVGIAPYALEMML